MRRSLAVAALTLTMGGAQRIPPPRAAAPEAQPAFVYVHLSAAHVHPGTWWSGRFVTTTNVASLVISMPFFSFEVPRTRFGDFSFRTYVQTVPPLYRQLLHGSLIAYAASGASTSLPIEMSFR